MASSEGGCFQRAISETKPFVLGGLAVGFMNAHNTFKKIKLPDKQDRLANFGRSLSVLSRPIVFFSAVGFTYAASTCTLEQVTGKESTWNGLGGAVAAGSLVGLRAGSIQTAAKASGAFALCVLTADLMTKFLHPAFDDIKISGPVVETHKTL